MSVEPPPSGRPTGPPPGPLSGGGPPAGPPSGPPALPPRPPPSPPPGGTPGGAPEPRRPWWRSAPRLALLTTALVAVAALALVLTRTDGGGTPAGQGEVFLQAAAGTGPYPFTDNTATATSAPPTSTAPATEERATDVVRAVDGGAGGLYGGTRDVAACDVEKQIAFLGAEPARNRAFASVARVDPAQVPAYLRSLTPVQLRLDTRVTNHGYSDGEATGYQAVLQAGTAVLVDARGEPRVRCACGNPLTRPIAQKTAPEPTGDSWPSYRPSNVVVVLPSSTVIDVFVLHDGDDDGWFARERGDTGREDRPAAAPENPPTPSGSVFPPASPSTPGTPCPSRPADAPGSSTCPPASAGTSPPSLSPASPPPPSPEPEPPSPQPPAPPSPGAPSTGPTSAPPPGPSGEPGHGASPRPAGGAPAL
ncbi:DUF6777 domain-containing protein [Streptomyces sp. NPDC059894]|uniref:DUF6777 domain-containing protein n=1 Tax=unclassified Streptomyces TaxID=2593676 RepID=UPI003654188C